MKRILPILATLALVLTFIVAAPAASAKGKPGPTPTPTPTPVPYLSINISPQPVYTLDYIGAPDAFYDLVFTGLKSGNVARWHQGPIYDDNGNLTGYCLDSYGYVQSGQTTQRSREWFACAGPAQAWVEASDGTHLIDYTWDVLTHP